MHDAHTKRLPTKRLLDKTSPNKTSPRQNVSGNYIYVEDDDSTMYI